MHAAASQTGDFDNLVAGYRADSDVRYADGVLLDGQQAIEQHYRKVLEYGPTAMAHSHPKESVRIRFLRDDVAFADVVSLSGGGIDENGKAIAQRRVAFFVVFTKIDGEWGVTIERMGATLP
jgi:ketosteroid isomerase-like protein